MFNYFSKISFYAIVSNLIIIPTLANTGYFPPAFEKNNVEEMQIYLDKVSRGSIYLKNHSQDIFYINRNQNVALSQNIFDYEHIQNIFSTNVLKYIENEGADDFLSAKKQFYSRQKYNSHTQSYERPYVYLSAWNSLNHPQIKKLEYPLPVYNQNFSELDYETLDSNFFNEDLHKEIDKLTNTEMTLGNVVQQLNNNQSYFAKQELIRNSQKYFFGVVMVAYCDESSSSLINAMIERAKAGVDVRMIVEGIWSNLAFKDCVNKMRNGGVKVVLSNNFFHSKTLFTVMHNKMWIADGNKAIIGGQNVHEFENESTGFNMHTRDKDVLVKQGPVVTDMLGEYIKLWNLFKNSEEIPSIKQYEDLWRSKIKTEKQLGLRGDKNYSKWLSSKKNRLNGLCRVVVQGEQTERDLISKLYLKLIEQTQNSIIFSTPNLSFDETNDESNKLNSKLIYSILNKANSDKIKVDVISNGVDASGTETGFYLRKRAEKLFHLGKIAKVKMLLKLQDQIAKGLAKKQRKVMYAMSKVVGVDTWTYSGHIHAKQMIFDRVLTSTGTFNFDSHSYKNHEATLLCLDKNLAQESEAGFALDLINSVPVL